MDRAKAKSMTRSVQTVAVGLLGLGAVAAVVPLGAKAEQPDAATTAAAQPTAPVAPKPPAAPKFELDAPTVAANLDLVAGPVKNGPAPVPEPGADPVAPPPVAGIDACKYLGGIVSDTYSRAIIVLSDGQQRILGVGQKFKPDPAGQGEVEIVEIDRAFVKVKEGEVEHTISIAPRQRAAATVVDPAVAAAAAGGRGGGNVPGGANGMKGGMPQYNAASRLNDLERMRMDAKNRGDSKMAESLDNQIGEAAKAAKLEKGDKGQK